MKEANPPITLAPVICKISRRERAFDMSGENQPGSLNDGRVWACALQTDAYYIRGLIMEMAGCLDGDERTSNLVPARMYETGNSCVRGIFFWQHTLGLRM